MEEQRQHSAHPEGVGVAFQPPPRRVVRRWMGTNGGGGEEDADGFEAPGFERGTLPYASLGGGRHHQPPPNHARVRRPGRHGAVDAGTFLISGGDFGATPLWGCPSDDAGRWKQHEEERGQSASVSRRPLEEVVAGVHPIAPAEDEVVGGAKAAGNWQSGVGGG